MSDVTNYVTFASVEESEHYYSGVTEEKEEREEKGEEGEEGEEGKGEEDEMGMVRGAEIKVEKNYYVSKSLWENEEDEDAELGENEEKYYGWQTLWEPTEPSL